MTMAISCITHATQFCLGHYWGSVTDSEFFGRFFTNVGRERERDEWKLWLVNFSLFRFKFLFAKHENSCHTKLSEAVIRRTYQVMVAQRHILMKWKVDDLPSHALQADILKHCRTHNMSHRQVSGYSGKEWIILSIYWRQTITSFLLPLSIFRDEPNGHKISTISLNTNM
jgi:hypothetical protein